MHESNGIEGDQRRKWEGRGAAGRETARVGTKLWEVEWNKLSLAELGGYEIGWRRIKEARGTSDQSLKLLNGAQAQKSEEAFPFNGARPVMGSSSRQKE